MKNLALMTNDESTFCKISLNNGSTWTQGIVVNFSEHDNTIRIFLSSRNFYKYYNSTSKIIVKTLDNKNEYIYIGYIDTNLSNHKSHFIKVNIDETLSFYDNRTSTRFLVNYIASITCEDNKSFTAKLADLSINGLCFSYDKNLKIGSKILISVKISPSNKIKLYGTIINQQSSNGTYKYSVKTESYSKDDQDVLINVLEDLLLKQNGIYKKYSFLQIPKKIAIFSLYLICISTIIYLLYLLYYN